MKKVGLIHSSNKDFAENQNYGLQFAPVWAFVLSTYIKDKGHEIALYDLNVFDKEIIGGADAYFLSGINQDLSSLIDVAGYLRQNHPGVPLFLGGPIAWSFDQAGQLDQLATFDHICIGDGELLVGQILDALESGTRLPHVIKEVRRFDLSQARPMDAALVRASFSSYYGAVIEVSRGCPFLCEFCDIRVMPDNNQSHNRSVEVIVAELDLYRQLGIRNIQLACDNFIGDYEWANRLVDAIIEYNECHGFAPSFYTWLTINVANHEELLRKMRVAGFDNLFIGVESFEGNTLLETAKLQNTKFDLIDSIKKIQSFGFVIVAGLIFGFDSDTDKSFETTLEGISETGLLSGDASLLTALPGTPLFRRMRLSGRLRDFKHDALLGGHKYVTNIKYLMARDKLINGYITFSKRFLDGRYQYSRISKFYRILTASGNFVNITRPGYTDVGAFLVKAIRSPSLLAFHLKRLMPLLVPSRLYYLVKAILLGLYMKLWHGIGFQYLVFWLFIWVNALSKYGSIVPADFNIESVPADFDIAGIIPAGYLEQANEKIPQSKINAQYKATVRQLENVIRINKAGA
jgi:radical SAM superfamily enzyme YgiQ (UPF0313 family)